jgi:hypothetical protein
MRSSMRNLFKVEKHLLSAFQGEAGDDYITPGSWRCCLSLQPVYQLPLPGDLELSVAVGGFHNYVVCLVKDSGVVQDGLVPSADIAGEQQFVVAPRDGATFICIIAEPSTCPASKKVAEILSPIWKVFS